MMSRRTILGAGAGLAALSMSGARITAATAATDKRLMVIILRGAADGLSIAAPTGDPGFARARAAWSDSYASAPSLGGMFSLHPALKRVGEFYAQGDALVAHAIATNYRERSHFDAQNLLESGGLKAYERRDGFLNRALGLMPAQDFPALAIAPTLPLAMRGDNPVTSYAPTKLPDASGELVDRVRGLYSHDPQLEQMWDSAIKTRGLAGDSAGENLRGAVELGNLAARLMDNSEGARLVMVDLPGWDSHAGQELQLKKTLANLDATLGAFHDAIGPMWANTVVAVVTEFGRTVAINGTKGTDHGTASAGLLLGGAVNGGRVVSDWPGLAPSQLYEGRDLMPTGSVEAFLTGALSGHFGLDPVRTFDTMFPGRNQRAMEGLIA
ncbi:DUF1501 domain-containing protein [Qipengyuania marisflavi]|uniref:DUF1501 domain-containing protein n=1 Tax=Qipengyuania marisflavi TaxID=2486356 RepID=A0A5S3P974_9SPHN|nr:DUF1501 domain-containing protein [Qipengyuania marisflavi]TMM49004.1 DUF1501 domain-containing protein [Qipengyuania marisflavi]